MFNFLIVEHLSKVQMSKHEIFINTLFEVLKVPVSPSL